MPTDWSDELTVILGSVATVQEREEVLSDPIREELLNRARERTQEMVRHVTEGENVSHDARGALQALIGSLYVLDEQWDELDEPARAALLSIARTAARRLATDYETDRAGDARHAVAS